MSFLLLTLMQIICCTVAINHFLFAFSVCHIILVVLVLEQVVQEEEQVTLVVVEQVALAVEEKVALGRKDEKI
jgi:hypothetical protein